MTLFICFISLAYFLLFLILIILLFLKDTKTESYLLLTKDEDNFNLKENNETWNIHI